MSRCKEVHSSPSTKLCSKTDWEMARKLCHQSMTVDQVFVEDMMEHPNNGYALLGVSQALRSLGRDADADRLHGVFLVTSFSPPPSVALHLP